VVSEHTKRIHGKRGLGKSTSTGKFFLFLEGGPNYCEKDALVIHETSGTLEGGMLDFPGKGYIMNGFTRPGRDMHGLPTVQLPKFGGIRRVREVRDATSFE
jgi:hypothetical protein